MKLGVLFFSSIYERTGAGKVVRSFHDNIHLFHYYGINETDVYSLDGSTVTSFGSAKKNGVTDFCKFLVAKILSKTAKGAFVLVDQLYFEKGRRVINSTWNSLLKKNVLIFHEIYTCSAYVNRCKYEGVEPKPFILVLHTNGEIFKMTKIYYPNIKDSKYEKLLNAQADKCLANASKIVFVSQLSLNKFIELYPQYSDKVAVVYNGVSLLESPSSPTFDGKIKMVTVGTVNARKNQIMQVEAVNIIKGLCNVELTVVGDGEKLDECKARAKQYGLEDRVHFLGGRDDIPQILAEHNLFVMSSYDEGLPISAIEALRAKLPIILTNVGGDKELITENGYLIETNKEELVDAILKFSSSIENQKKMSQISFDMFMNRFTVEKMISGYSSIIKDIICI